MARVKGITGNKSPKTGVPSIYEVIREDNTTLEDYAKVSWQLYLKDETGNWIKHPKSPEKTQKGASQEYKFGELFTNQELLLTAFNEKPVLSEPPAFKITPIAGEPKITKLFFTDLTGKTLEEISYSQRVMLQIHTIGMLEKTLNYSIYDELNGTKTEVRKGQSLKIVKPNGVVNPEDSFFIDMPIRTGQSTSADEHHFKIKIWETGNEANFLEQDLKIKNQTVNQMSDPDTQVPITTGTSGPVKKKEEEKKDGKCFCDRGFTPEEMKTIVIALRKGEITGFKTKKVEKIINGEKKIVSEKVPITIYDWPKTRDLLFANQGDVKRSEHLSVEDSSYEKVTNMINKAMKKYNINTCIRKIHFISQAYHESHRFRATFEGRSKDNTPSNYGGGYNFQGRGFMQLTHDYNYIKYYNKVYNKDEKLTDKVFYNNKLIPFTKLLATNLEYAFDSAGWYWHNEGKVNAIGVDMNIAADKDNTLYVSQGINGKVKHPNGLAERIKYVSDLKKIMEYENCINKKK